MRHLTIRLLAVAAVAAISLPAYAQSPIQLRFNVQPAANDPVWQSFKGQTLEKYAECYYSNDASRAAGWNPGRSTIFSGKTVLFNPGNTTWSGGKQVFTPNTPPEPTNTLLMLPAGLSAQTKSIVCRARILANGQNVTANVNDIVFRLTDEVAKSGPPVVSVKLDASKIPTPKLQPKFYLSSGYVFPDNSGKSAWQEKTVIIVYKNELQCLEKADPAKGIPVPGCFVNVKWRLERDKIDGVLPINVEASFEGIAKPPYGFTSKHTFPAGEKQITVSGKIFFPLGTSACKTFGFIAFATEKGLSNQTGSDANVCLKL